MSKFIAGDKKSPQSYSGCCYIVYFVQLYMYVASICLDFH